MPTVTSLPGSPANGDEVYYQFNRGDGTNAYWHLRYNSGTTYWDYLGGPSMYTSSTANPINQNNTTFASFSPAVSITMPLAGDYDTSWGVGAAYAQNNFNAVIGLSVNGSTPSYPGGNDVAFEGTNPNGTAAPLRNTYRVVNGGASQTLEVKYMVSTNGANGQFFRPSLMVTPIRVK